jgi:hypothetical protein
VHMGMTPILCIPNHFIAGIQLWFCHGNPVTTEVPWTGAVLTVELSPAEKLPWTISPIWSKFSRERSRLWLC